MVAFILFMTRQEKEIDNLINEIIIYSENKYLFDDVSLDLTVSGWIARIEVGGKILHEGNYKNNPIDALLSLKEKL